MSFLLLQYGTFNFHPLIIKRMLNSMTVYGLSSQETPQLSVTVEIKSLNSKFLDINLKLPKEYAEKELEIRNILGNTLERGKVGLSIDVEEKGDVKAKVSVNKELVRQYYN